MVVFVVRWMGGVGGPIISQLHVDRFDRWALDQGMPVIPKTTHPQRMAENLAALTACPPLEPDDMKALDALDKGPGAKFAWDPEKVV